MEEISSTYLYPHYEKWIETRLNKLYSILGKDWFKGKKILELACCQGQIGQHLRKLGATVKQTEGRKEYCQNTGARVLDQDKKWDLKKKFDLVIHWGILYHLDDWERDLKTAIKHGSIIALESEVLDSKEIEETKVNEVWNDGALNHTGTRPSVYAIEKCITEIGATFKRYDDKDLDVNTGWIGNYSWKEGEAVGKSSGESEFRRFWIIRRKVTKNEQDAIDYNVFYGENDLGGMKDSHC